MRVRTESGHVVDVPRAKALKLIEAGAQQVADDAPQDVETSTAEPGEVETTEAPAAKAAPRKRAPRKATKAD